VSEIDTRSLQALLDREAIRDCLYRYCRGIDRLDEEALRSAYWPDAIDSHGAYRGPASGFIDRAVSKLKTGGRMVHMIGNVLIDWRGDVAAVESYFVAFQESVAGDDGSAEETLLCGRYIDRFEKRGNEWRIAARTVAYDWQRRTPLPKELTAAVFGARQPTGGRRPDDPIYELLAALEARGAISEGCTP
jgi:SnoaL-like domain